MWIRSCSRRRRASRCAANRTSSTYGSTRAPCPAQVHYPFEHEADFGEIYPADFIAEGVDGWFFTLHAIATMLFDSVAFKKHHLERSGARQERQQDVETAGQRRRSVRGALDLRSGRHALVHDLQLAAVGQPQVRPRRRGRGAPQVLRHALQHLLLLRALRQRGRLHGPRGGGSDGAPPRDRPLDRLAAQHPRARRHGEPRVLRPDPRGPRHPGVRGRKPLELVRAPEPQSASGAAACRRTNSPPTRRSTPVWRPWRCSRPPSRRSSPTASSRTSTP